MYTDESKRRAHTSSYSDVFTEEGKGRSRTRSFSRDQIRSRSFSRSFHSTISGDAVEPIVEEEEFVPSVGLTQKEAEQLLQKYGRNELQEKSKSKLMMFIEQFTAPMPIMIWIAIAVEAALQDWTDMCILLGMQAINGGIGFYEMAKAGDAVAALKASLKPKAIVKRDGVFRREDAANLVPGDLVSLTAGQAVPADCKINHGTIDVDQAALTGESMPVTMHYGDSPKMGSNVATGETEATVIATGMNTFFGKTAGLIQSVDELGNLQKVLLKIMAFLIIISFVLCGICLGYLLKEGEDFDSAISFVVVLLIASIPIAIEVVVTATMALGSRELSRKGAIVARLSAIEELASMNMLCSDKTGTLTMNKMMIQDDCPLFSQEVSSKDDVVFLAGLAAKWWEPPKDALDTMVLGALDVSLCDPYKQTDYLPFNPTIKRTEATIIGPDGKEFKVTKGAPHVVLDLCHDKDSIMDDVDEKVLELAEHGIRSLAVAKTDSKGRWHMMGILTFLDPPRPDTKETIASARHFGVEVKMITGDHQVIAVETARQLEMGTKILGCGTLPTLGPEGEMPEDMDSLAKEILDCNGFAQVFPEHKFVIIEALRRQGFVVGMTGDGVNDAPALKKADVGVAVDAATDAARAASDIVLTEPGLLVIVDAIKSSRRIFSRMKSFIVYRVACTLQLLVFFFIAVLFLHPDYYNPEFPEFWYMPVIALIIITLLNDGTIISIAYDNVEFSQNPESWNLAIIFVISTILGMIACVSSLLLLYWALNSEDPDSLLSRFGIALDFPEVMAVMYLKVSISDFLTLFASRTQGFFFTKAPGKLLFGAFIFAVGLSTTLSIFWPFGQGMTPLPAKMAAVVWAYCLVWFLIQDTIKTAAYAFMTKFNILGINNSRSIVEGAKDFKEEESPDYEHKNEESLLLPK